MSSELIISEAKNKIIRDFIKDDELVRAIGVDPSMSREKLIGKYIFDYNQNPNTINDVGTFITVLVHIPRRYYGYKKMYVYPTVDIWIISHQRHMKVDDIPKVIGNRNDYISRLIGRKLNGSNLFGLGDLELTENVEGAIQSDYLYRNMIFQCAELSRSMCVDE